MWSFARALLFRFEAETAHELAKRATLTLPGFVRRALAGPPSFKGARPVWDLPFRNPIGLGGGFDKNAEWLPALPDLGFGFAEIGTVTPRPQGGNPRPRLFRDPERRALFNRMGFNNLGVAAVRRNLEAARPKLPDGFRVGVNLGKNKDTPDADAPLDYARAAEAFEGLADYLVINVSSPNTPGLRALQTVEALKPILGSVLQVVSRWSKAPPVLLKLAPELDASALAGLIPPCESEGARGWILTNTLAGTYAGGAGGWSGGPLRELALQRLREAHGIARTPIVSVGGILAREDARERLEAGASLMQVYSGWIYGGPRFIQDLLGGLEDGD